MRSFLTFTMILLGTFPFYAQSDSVEITTGRGENARTHMEYHGTISIDKVPDTVIAALRARHQKSTIIECYLYGKTYSFDHKLMNGSLLRTTIYQNGFFYETTQKFELGDVPFTVLEGFRELTLDTLDLNKVKCKYVLLSDGATYFDFSCDGLPIDIKDGYLVINTSWHLDAQGKEVEY